MADASNEASRFKLADHISAVDSFLGSPEQLAQQYKQSLEAGNKDGVLSPVSWPAVCYSLILFTHQASLYEFLQQSARDLNKIIYTAHYFHADSLGLLDTPEKKEKWAALNLQAMRKR